MKRVIFFLILIILTFNTHFSYSQAFLGADDTLYPGTWSLRENPDGSVTSYYDMTDPNNPDKWNSSPYKEYMFLTGSTPSAYTFKLNCRILFPKGYDQPENADKKYPVFLFLNGVGEAGIRGTGSFEAYEPDDPRYLNNDHNLMHGGEEFMKAARPDLWNSIGRFNAYNTVPEDFKFDGFVVVPQNRKAWDYHDILWGARIIEAMTRQFRVDENRVYVNGLSDGGDGVWEFIRDYPYMFAAALPMSGILDAVTYDGTLVEKIIHIPTWIFNGGTDDNPSPEKVQNAIDLLTAKGGTPRHTEYANRGHGIWGNAWNEPDFWSWMQRYSKLTIHPLFGKTKFCEGESFSVTLGVSPGFDGYRWKKVINGVETVLVDDTQQNEITVNEFGDYYVQIKRRGTWTDWSEPLSITIKELTPTPVITSKTSTTLPSLDGNPAVLEGPEGYEDYQWYKDGSQITGAKSFSYETTEGGNYQLIVTEKDGCPSLLSEEFIVTEAPYEGPLPVKPENFRANSLSETEIVLNWEDNISNEKGFEIYRKKQGESFYILAAKLFQNVTTFTDQDLQPNTTYIYNMRAYNDYGGSGYTGDVSASTFIDDEPPSPPANLMATSKTQHSIGLNWDKSTDNVGIAHYQIYVINVTDGFDLAGSPFTTTDVDYIVDNLEHEKLYKFYVLAEDGSGNISNKSNEIVEYAISSGVFFNYYAGGTWDKIDDWDDGAWPVAFSGRLPNFIIKTVSEGGVRPDEETDYYAFEFIGEIFIESSGDYTFYTNSDDGSRLWIGPEGTEDLVVDNDGLHGMTKKSGTINLAAGPHRIMVKFFERSGGDDLIVSYKGPDTGGNEIVIPDDALKSSDLENPSGPAAPQLNPLANITYRSIELSWIDNSTSPDLATGFEIYRSDTVNNNYKIIATTSNTNYLDEDIAPSTDYYYKLKAINEYGSSDFSNSVSGTSLDLPAYHTIASDALNRTSTWKNNEDLSPSDFNQPNQIFIIDHNGFLDGDWLVTGSGSKVIVTNSNVISVEGNDHVIDIPELLLEDNASLILENGTGSTQLNVGDNGITLKTGSKLVINHNSVIIEGEGFINKNNEAGMIAVDNGNITFNNHSSDNSNLNFEQGNNTAYNVTINSNGSGSVVLKNQLNVVNTVKLQDGTFDANGQLVLLSNENSTARIAKVEAGASLLGSITMQRYIGPSKNQGWYNISTSLKNQTLNDWSDDFKLFGNNTPYARHFDEPNSKWVFAPNLDYSVTPGSGVQVFIYEDQFSNGGLTVDNTGEPVIGDGQGNNTGDFVIDLSKSGTFDGGGWNLIAVPYPSEINFDAEGWDKSNIANSYYIWDGANNKYESYVNGVGTGGLDGIIPSGQAFFVYANASGANPGILRKNAPDNLIRIKMTAESGRYDECVIRFLEEATNDFDQNFDAFKLENSDINLSSLSEDIEDLSINTLSYPINKEKVNLSLKAHQEGVYKLTFEGISSVDTPDGIYLKDNYNQQVIDLSQEYTYSFEINSDAGSSGDERFHLILLSERVVNIPDLPNTLQLVKVHPNPFNNHVNFDLLAEHDQKVDVVIYDYSGKVVYEKAYDIGKGVNTIKVNEISLAPNRFYIYKIITSDKILSGKIIKGRDK